jgi:four helix bundle protein
MFIRHSRISTGRDTVTTEVPHGIIVSGFTSLAGSNAVNVETYKATISFPRHELYGLSQQMRRAAVSVASNIAEGKGHRPDREFSSFLFHARGSLLELQTQLMIAQELQYLSNETLRLMGLAAGVGRSLSGLINSLREKLPDALAKDQRRMTND